MSLVILTTRKTIGPFDIKERKPKMPGVTKYTVWKGDAWEKDFGRYSAAIRWAKSQCPRVVPHVVITLEGGLIQGLYCDVPLDAVVVDFDVEAYDMNDLTKVPDIVGGTEDADVRGCLVDSQSAYGKLLINAVVNNETIL